MPHSIYCRGCNHSLAFSAAAHLESHISHLTSRLTHAHMHVYLVMPHLSHTTYLSPPSLSFTLHPQTPCHVSPRLSLPSSMQPRAFQSCPSPSPAPLSSALFSSPFLLPPLFFRHLNLTLPLLHRYHGFDSPPAPTPWRPTTFHIQGPRLHLRSLASPRPICVRVLPDNNAATRMEATLKTEKHRG